MHFPHIHFIKWEDANANPKLIHWLQFKTIPHLTLAHRSHCRECALFVWEDGFLEVRHSEVNSSTRKLWVIKFLAPVVPQRHKHTGAAGEDESKSDLNHTPQNKTRTAMKPAAVCIMDRLHANQFKWNEKCIYLNNIIRPQTPVHSLIVRLIFYNKLEGIFSPASSNLV